MDREELHASWRRTEANLRDAVSHQELPDDLRRLVLEFVDHNELGVAFEMLVSALVEAEANLDRRAREVLAAAAHEMGLERNDDWIALTS